MDRRAAERIVPMLLQGSSALVATIDVLEEYASGDEVKDYSKAMGQVMFAIYAVLRPITNEYPDLHP